MTDPAVLAGLPVSLADVTEARERIGDTLPRTPLLSTQTLGRMSNTTLHLKAENLQRTGSYKVRGMLNAMRLLTDEQKGRGVVTFSAGNAGAGLAWAAREAGTDATVYMMKGATQSKVDAIRSYGANTIFGEDIATAFAMMEQAIAQDGKTFISPFADPPLIAGQGTVGLEILEDRPQVEAIVVPIGGGGLISGLAVAVKSLRPDVRIIGVEPVGADVMRRSLDAGSAQRLDKVQTVADGLAAPFTTETNLSIIRALVDDIVLVTDDEIIAALKLILERTKLLPEPSGAAGVAALLTGKAGLPHGTDTVAVLSGGNIDLARLKTFL